MEKSPSHYYEQQINTLSISLKVIHKKMVSTGFVRLFVGLAILICIYNLFRTAGDWAWWLTLLALVILFVLLIRRSIVLNDKQRYQEALKKINLDELAGIQGNFEAFDRGEDLQDLTHPFTFDLDVFGDKSLFQRISRTVSFQGRTRLARLLTEPEQDAEKIQATQKMLQEIQELPAWRQDFLAMGTISSEDKLDRQAIETWLKLPPVLSQSKVWPVVLILMPVLSVGSWILFLAGPLPIWITILMTLILLGITGNQASFINKRHLLITKKSTILKKYHDLVYLFTSQELQAPGFLTMQQTLNAQQHSPASFARFIKLINALDNRLNMIMAIVLNGLLLWDLNCLVRIEKWNQGFQEQFPYWMETIGELDALISLAGYNFNHPDYNTPIVLDQKQQGSFLMEITEGTHPLLYPDPSVPNSLKQPEELNLFLITGANMAGKSTFLRTVGLNMILAMAGTNVAAKAMTLTPVQLCTSMRTNDSLLKHTSFFYAELKKLKWIMDKVKAKEPVYIMLDEILKGTNSKDQHLGSAALIKNIIQHGGRGLIATHDLELTGLAATFPKQIKNIAFEIDMEGDEMIFSYQYKDGVCQNMNASMLMKQMGIT